MAYITYPSNGMLMLVMAVTVWLGCIWGWPGWLSFLCEAHSQLSYHCELWVWGSPTVALSLWIMGVRLTHSCAIIVNYGCEAHSHLSYHCEAHIQLRYWLWGSLTFPLLDVRLTHISATECEAHSHLHNECEAHSQLNTLTSKPSGRTQQGHETKWHSGYDLWSHPLK